MPTHEEESPLQNIDKSSTVPHSVMSKQINVQSKDVEPKEEKNCSPSDDASGSHCENEDSSDRENIENEILNPFYHRVEFRWPYDYIKVAVLGVLLLPLRIIGITISLILAYIVSTLGLYGVNRKTFDDKPVEGWRNKLRWGMGFSGRLMMRCYGFHFVKIKGTVAPRSEAPITVVAPHSSFFDGVAVYWAEEVPGLVSRRENVNIPLFGKYIDFTQPVYVWRESTNSRQKTIEEIKKRAKSEDKWPQVMVFPEGTCTNRTCLITFKPGAFYPGLPVQPVTIKYHNHMDTTTWTWDGTGALKLLLLTLSQFHNYCEIEYLPVYYPSEEEKADARLYASNVRTLMAKSLGIPTVDYTFDDCRIMAIAKKNKLPPSVGLVEFHKLRQKYSISLKDVESALKSSFALMADKKSGYASLKSFSDYLKLPMTEQMVVKLFNLMDKSGRGRISFRDYILAYCEILRSVCTPLAVVELYSCFDTEKSGSVSRERIAEVLKKSLLLTEDCVLSANLPKDKDSFNLGDFEEAMYNCPEYAWLFKTYRESMKDGSRLNSGASAASVDKQKHE